MIHINYKLDKSDKHGIGLFTAEDINEGDIIYTGNKGNKGTALINV